MISDIWNVKTLKYKRSNIEKIMKFEYNWRLYPRIKLYTWDGNMWKFTVEFKRKLSRYVSNWYKQNAVAKMFNCSESLVNQVCKKYGK